MHIMGDIRYEEMSVHVLLHIHIFISLMVASVSANHSH